jgi:hypothetical protein
LWLPCTGTYVNQGCFWDGNGPYQVPAWSGGRLLPAALNGKLWTVDQCAREAAKRGFDAFGMEGDGQCFMGTMADVAKMTTTADDTACSNTPCLGGAPCIAWALKVFSIGRSSMSCTFSQPFVHFPTGTHICTHISTCMQNA